MKKLATFATLVVLGCFVFGCLGCGDEKPPKPDDKDKPVTEHPEKPVAPPD